MPLEAILRVRFLPLMLLLLAACEAPPTQQQVTSRAVVRNCEARGAAAAEKVRKQNTQMIKEGSASAYTPDFDIEARAEKARDTAFKNCMFDYSV